MNRITFHGAAETVTGSKYLLESARSKVLIDCGLFQGLKELRQRNWQPPPFQASTVDSIVVTHAHIDHIGYLPRLVRDGFRGNIYCTAATAQLCELQLFDTAHCEEEDARYANRKGYSKHRPALPLFDSNDVRRTLTLLRSQPTSTMFCAAQSIYCAFHDAGHLLGSAMIEVELRDSSPPIRILFSGDVGRYDAPLYHDPKPPPQCDYLICESTYGDRDHPVENALDELSTVVRAGIERGGVIVIAAFAVGRTQQLVYLLQTLARQQRIPSVPTYVDSPMAIEASQIYCEHAADHDLSEARLTVPVEMLDWPAVHYTRTTQESKEINAVDGPAIIISSSGMMTGGRILHHLKHRLSDSRNTILIGGYMAPGTRGRMLADGAPYLRLQGRDVPNRAAVARIPALSGHADRSELLRWLSPLATPRTCFLTHGELTSARSLAEELHSARGWNVQIPRQGQSFELAST
ncbi:MAG: MBL fold metallo-hydrolase [Planctomycetota bacterium]|nr:MBL fold metallo-hydrolase [Planctomycetota bacterium]